MAREHLHEDHPHIVARNASNGMILFFLYLLLYVGFVVLNIFAPAVMANDTLGGVNLAIAYGVGLILAALILALVYMWTCRGGSGSAS
jgi:uncharacterized membrane protein (DUF485 family)